MSLQRALEDVFGSLAELPVTGVTPVTSYPVTGKKINGNKGNSGNRSKVAILDAIKSEPVTVVQFGDDGWTDEREAIARELGGVPNRYALAIARMQARQPESMSAADWLQALNDAGIFVDTWGSQAAKLGWTAVDLFERVPNGCNGLLWELRGRPVVALTADGAAIGEEGELYAWFARPPRQTRQA